MNINEIKQTLKLSDDYSFLRDDLFFRKNMILLTLGGSHAYGTNIETSDLDIRGVATNPKREILLGLDFEQKVNNATDTTIYSAKKIVSLLTKANPNTLEILGCKPEHYLYLSPEGQMLIDNRQTFLSKRAIYTFGGYANDQLHRLMNATIRDQNQDEREKHVLGRIQNATEHFKRRYCFFDDDNVHLFIDESRKDEFSTEIYANISLDKYPLRDFTGLITEMSVIIREYDKVGVRNRKAITHNKLNKHMMHLVRLYLMCFDILERGEINTYREKDHDLLMDIRNGKYLSEDNQPIPAFMEMVAELESKLDQLAKTTSLPDKPDQDQIDRILMDICESVLSREI